MQGITAMQRFSQNDGEIIFGPDRPGGLGTMSGLVGGTGMILLLGLLLNYGMNERKTGKIAGTLTRVYLYLVFLGSFILILFLSIIFFEDYMWATSTTPNFTPPGPIPTTSSTHHPPPQNTT